MASLKISKKFGSSVEQAHTFRVAVFGQTGVGKTALIVRFVTEKFIGEYDPNLEMIYQRLLVFPPTSDIIFFEIIDTLDQDKEDPEILQEKIKWADAFVLVFSITDHKSLRSLPRLKNLIWNTINGNACCEQVNQELPLIIVGNKNDLQSQRTISIEEGAKLAADFNCPYFEISVRESVEETVEVFTALYESHKKILKTGSGRKRSDYGPHIDIPMMPHHLPLLSNLHRHRSFKHVDKLQRMQGSASADSIVLKQTKLKKANKESPKRNNSRKSYDERKNSVWRMYERHVGDISDRKNKALSDTKSKFADIGSGKEDEQSPYDNSSDDGFSCEHIKRISMKQR